MDYLCNPRSWRNENIPFENFLHEGLKQSWIAKPKSVPNICLKELYDLKIFHKNIPLGLNELSGTFGENWIIWEKGSIRSSPATNTSHFSWHYHPDGDARFSYNDWRTFIYLPSPLSLLVTDSQINIYIKKEDGPWQFVKSWISQEDIKLQKNKTLKFMRFCKFINRTLDILDINTSSELKICDSLGIKFSQVTIHG